MMPHSTTIACPVCFSKIELAAAAPYKFPYHLSIICMTKGGDVASSMLEGLMAAARSLGAELIIGLDSGGRIKYHQEPFWKLVPINGDGYVESTLNQLARHANGQWVLRIDDDESIPPAMIEWLKRREYQDHPAWAFPTAALWKDDKHFITTPPFWPDTHVRLTSWHLAADWPDEPHGKPAWVHTAQVAPVAILHHKFLIKSYDQRRAIAEKYESKMKGGGLGKRLVYSCPEDVLHQMNVYPVGDGMLNQVPRGAGELIDVN